MMRVIGVRDVLNFDVRLSDLLRGASRPDELHPCGTEALCELGQPSFVVDGQQSFEDGQYADPRWHR